MTFLYVWTTEASVFKKAMQNLSTFFISATFLDCFIGLSFSLRLNVRSTIIKVDTLDEGIVYFSFYFGNNK